MDFVEEQGILIVANGRFNPAIFQPSWLESQGILSGDETSACEIEIIHPEITRFQVPGIKFDVQNERFSIAALAEPFIRVADVFFVIFEEKLTHTPIDTVGLNYYAHVRLGDWKQRNRFGRKLAPLEPWGEYGKLLESSEAHKVGGISTLSMRAIKEDYGKEGGINVAVQPSVKISDSAGVFFNVNHHFGAGAGGEESLVSTLHKRFDELLRESREIIDHMTTVGRAA